MADPDQLEDPQVFLALRLPALRGSDHEHARIDPADTGQHVAKEPHVTGHVDEADSRAAREGRVGEAEVDRQPAAALFLEPVGVGSRQRFDQ